MIKIKGLFVIIIVFSISLIYIQCKSSAKPAAAPPHGMILIHGGITKTGFHLPDFYLDISPVTVAQFDSFVKATGYKTEAERFGNAGVFDTSLHKWILVDGATFWYPLGPAHEKAAPNMPATQISWHDAQAYCQWAGKRLPTKEEWTYAAMNANANYNHLYPWGDSLVENGKYMANVWEGEFPYFNTKEDGYAYASPVGIFGKTPLGLTDMGGNIWEWLQDWKDNADTTSAEAEKLQMGGSFLCDADVCHGYKIGNTSSSTPETSLCHVGFRCAKNSD